MYLRSTRYKHFLACWRHYTIFSMSPIWHWLTVWSIHCSRLNSWIALSVWILHCFLARFYCTLRTHAPKYERSSGEVSGFWSLLWSVKWILVELQTGDGLLVVFTELKLSWSYELKALLTSSGSAWKFLTSLMFLIFSLSENTASEQCQREVIS